MTQYSKLEQLEQAILVEKLDQQKLAHYERYVTQGFQAEHAIIFAGAFYAWKVQADLLKDMES